MPSNKIYSLVQSNHFRMKSIFFVLLISIVLSISVEEFKHNQGPPSEFEVYKLPVPTETAQTSDSSIIHGFFSNIGEKKYEWKGDIFVDSTEFMSVTIASKLKNLKLTLEEPETKKGKKTPPPNITKGTFGMNNAVIPTTTYSYSFVEDQRGIWKATISYQGELPEDNFAHFGLIIENRSSFKVFSNSATFRTHVGKDIGLVTRLYSSVSKSTPEITPIAIPAKKGERDVNMVLVLPNGMRQVVQMEDDGRHFDGLENDGVYGATIKATEEGSYTAQVVMRGVTPEGQPFLRTTQHLIHVVDHDFDLTKEAKVKLVGNEAQFKLVLDDKAKDVVGENFKAYAEVWDSENKPIAWVSGMTVISKDQDGKYIVPLHLNVQWLTYQSKSIRKPATLRNVYIQHKDTSTPITSIEEMQVIYENDEILKQASILKSNGELNEEMLMGKRPEKYQLNKKLNEGKIVFVHGYCAGGNPFSTKEFKNFVEFNDPNKNRGNDEFARLLKTFIEPFTGVSFVAHSQGGLVATHLYTFYWSPTDLSRQGRIIQSVGSPYQGSGLAGSLADLGSSIGYGCGNNQDLTKDGSKNWLATIPLTQRKEVYHYITQYKDWSWCSLATNLVLEWPNDGVSEEKYSKLEGGQFLGTKKGWCHTSDLNYPPQGTDEARNKEMNDNAAR